jgi:hypothetical protein
MALVKVKRKKMIKINDDIIKYGGDYFQVTELDKVKDMKGSMDPCDFCDLYDYTYDETGELNRISCIMCLEADVTKRCNMHSVCVYKKMDGLHADIIVLKEACHGVKKSKP